MSAFLLKVMISLQLRFAALSAVSFCQISECPQENVYEFHCRNLAGVGLSNFKALLGIEGLCFPESSGYTEERHESVRENLTKTFLVVIRRDQGNRLDLGFNRGNGEIRVVVRGCPD